jgi:hypothetical protein
MKKIMMLFAVFALSASSAYAIDPQAADITCEELTSKYQLNAEGQLRFSKLKGSCNGVYIINGELYARSKAVIRSKAGGKVRLFLPANQKTFEVTPDPSGFVYFGGKKMRVRDLTRGDNIAIYLSLDKFAQERVDSVGFATEDASGEEMISVPAEQVPVEPETKAQ